MGFSVDAHTSEEGIESSSPKNHLNRQHKKSANYKRIKTLRFTQRLEGVKIFLLSTLFAHRSGRASHTRAYESFLLA